MGLVIGRRGATLDMITRNSGAKVDYMPRDSREMSIQGPPASVAKAEQLIRDVLAGKARLLPGQWLCCKAAAGAKGCTTKQGHVADANYMDRSAVVSTVERSAPAPGKVYAVDCEMVKSARGGELAKVTLLNWTGTVCYKRLVQPPVPVGDYKTRYSGITTAMLQGVTTSLKDVQGDLLNLIFANDIVVGHALQNDLKVLHLEHRMVVDTVLVFPHPDGPPKRMALRRLAKEHLGREIQMKGQTGHDSAEDALAALDLVKGKL
jgi:hypothetical protein